MRPFESKGVWWLPDTPTDQVPGVLSYSQADGSRLSLSGSLGRRQGDLPSFPVIHGIVEGGKAATLLESFAVKSSLGGVASTEIFSHFSLRGAHTKALSQQSFQKISIVIDSLAQWAAFTPLSSKLEFVKNRLSRIEVAYAFPKSRVYRGQTATYTVGSGFKTHGDMRHNVEIETLSGIRTPMVRASKGANTGRLGDPESPLSAGALKYGLDGSRPTGSKSTPLSEPGSRPLSLEFLTDTCRTQRCAGKSEVRSPETSCL